MANEPIITIVGNLVRDPEISTTSGGMTVVNFTVASTPRSFKRETGQWEEGETLFMRCTAWRELGDNVVESLSKGMRVIVQGRLQQRSWSGQDGQKQTSVEITVDEIGPSLRYATANVTRISGNGGFGNRQSGGPGYSGNGGGYNNQGAPANNVAPGGSANDPWGQPNDSAFDSAPPF